jgi:hypothetical protein
MQSHGQKQYGDCQPSAKQRLLQDINSIRLYGTIPDAEAPTRACIVPIAVNGDVAPALFDTGATMSVISEAMAHRLESAGKLQRYRSSMKANLFGDKQTVTFKDAAEVDVTLGPATVRLEVQILEDLPFDCLMGDNFLRQATPILDYYNRVIVVGSVAIPFMRRGQVIAMLSQLVCGSSGPQ